MQCPGCERENDPGSRFCIFCGFPLEKTGDDTDLPATEADEAQLQKIQALREEVYQLKERLSIIEQALHLRTPAPKPIHTASMSATTARKTIQENVSVKEHHVAFQPKNSAFSKFKEREWEQFNL